jgi:hypothetical protein
MLIPCLLLLATSTLADEKADGEKLARLITPYVDDQAFAILHVDLEKFDIGPIFDQMKKFGAPDRELTALHLTVKTIAAQMAKDNLKQVFVVVSLADMPDSLPLFVIPAGADADDKALRMLLALLDAGGSVKMEKRDGAILIGPRRVLRRVEGLKPTKQPELARAFASTGDATGRLVVFANATMRKAVEELVPTLPKEVGSPPITTITRGLLWIAVGVNVAPKMELRFTFQGSDESAAKELRKVFESMFRTIGLNKEVRKAYPDYDRMTAALLPRVQGDRLSATVKEEQLLALLVPAAEKVRESARTAVLMNNLKQIGLAFHNYHDQNGSLPAHASFDRQGKPLLSWRVHLLPYLGQEGLYKEFKLDEAWDSPHNRKLIAKMPKVYASTSDQKLAAEGRTAYVVATGPMTPFADGKGMAFTKVTDGLANTILVLDADDEHAVIWTKPEDLRVDLKTPLRGLRKIEERGYLVLMMDGSVHYLPADIDPKAMAAKITPEGKDQ